MLQCVNRLAGHDDLFVGRDDPQLDPRVVAVKRRFAGWEAVVLNGAHIGAGAVVAAGAVVRPGTQIPPGALAAGVPARVLDRPVPPVPRPNVASYLALADHYRNADVLRPSDPTGG